MVHSTYCYTSGYYNLQDYNYKLQLMSREPQFGGRHSVPSSYLLFCGLLGRLEHSDVSPRPGADKGHDEERDEGANSRVSPEQEVDVLRLGASEEPRGSAVAEATRRSGQGWSSS